MSESTPSHPPAAPNRLAAEQSPYLRMHAHNPVDWYPWGEEAFAKARREDKPIFLSIGYYTCHWCHVMERESFANPAIAELLNRDFVAIKVDREERPDVDRLYMSFVQATSGGGGWPLSAFLTPERKPFLGGTYFPPDDLYGRPGFATVLQSIAHTWQQERARVLGSAEQIAAALEQYLSPRPAEGGKLDAGVLDTLQKQLVAAYDEQSGGFGGAPKFPRPVAYTFLLQDFLRTGRRESLEMTTATLRSMARGGMYDQLGGGFHRYSTDAEWRVPHFEKMLYDQAQLVQSYVAAWQFTGEALFERVTHETLDYVLREMTSPEGGFYSAQDADSEVEGLKGEHAEGAFYVWRAAEIDEALGPAGAALFRRHFGVEEHGNVPAHQDPHGELRGQNVLFHSAELVATAADAGLEPGRAAELLAEGRLALFERRRLRPHPPTDDKVLTAWNGLMIGALAQAARVFHETRYLEAAQRAARFFEAAMYDSAHGTLLRRWRQGDSAIDGFVEDYAFLIAGLLDLYQADFDVDWLRWALRLQRTQDRLFWAEEAGGYYASTGADGSLFLRLREDYDGAEPSPNSIAVMNLLQLGQLSGDGELRDRARQVLEALGERLRKMPESLPCLAAGLDRYLMPPRQVILAGDPEAADTRRLRATLAARWLPYHALLLLDGGDGQKTLAEWQPALAGYGRQDDAATAYVCENFTCRLPTGNAERLAELLG